MAVHTPLRPTEMPDFLRKHSFSQGRLTCFHLRECAHQLEEFEAQIDKADEHTAFLMKSIGELEAKLRAAEFAAKTNYDGWQQELARNGHKPWPLTTAERT